MTAAGLGAGPTAAGGAGTAAGTAAVAAAVVDVHGGHGAAGAGRRVILFQKQHPRQS